MNIGPAEIFVILVFALLITGPERLPKFGASLGKAIYQFKDAQNKVTQTLEKEGLDLKNEGESLGVSNGGSNNPFLALNQASDQKNTSDEKIDLDATTDALNSTDQKQKQSLNLEGGSDAL